MLTHSPRPAYRLVNPIQPYAWGTRDEAAFIPRLLGQPPEPGRPYAELWMGAHPQAPSHVYTETGLMPLDIWLEQNPHQLLGGNPPLPFLFKVLSIAEPLSIQAHPNAEQAARLHARDPQHYPDPRAKPELVIALDHLEALVGFLPPSAWPGLALRYPELAAFVPQPWPSSPETLRVWYPALVQRLWAEPTAALLMLDALEERLRQTAELTPTEALFLSQKKRVAGPDVGLITVLLLHYVSLEAGAALFLSPGTPHAYLRGNALELMANSDNVVRAGLTNKFVDKEAWLEVLDYAMGGPQPARPVEQRLRSHGAPGTPLRVLWRCAEAGETCTVCGNGPAILLVLRGTIETAEGERFAQGEAAFLPATPGALIWRHVTAGEVVIAAATVWA